MKYCVVYYEPIKCFDTIEEAKEYEKKFLKQWNGATYPFTTFIIEHENLFKVEEAE